jgi:ABC-type multidrug transport system fused ATPase/permease subunit
MNSSTSTNNIINMYDKQTYFDQYSGSVVLFVVITVVVILMVSYFHVMTSIQPIINDWPNQRCKPTIMPFAGLITHPEGVTASEYTAQNFAYCTQTILSNITGDAVEPLTYITVVLQSIAVGIQESIQSIRAMFNKVRNSMQAVTEEIMGRLMNIMIPLQQIIIGFRDLVAKIQGTMTAGLFTLLGSYYTLKSLMGAIAQFIIIILIVLAAIIALFWIFPFTWGAAIANTSIFVALAIPMAIILAFMSDVLHVQPGGGLQIPSLKCFDAETMLTMEDGTKKRIVDIQVGEVLAKSGVVTATMCVTATGSQMYTLHSVVVSDSHIVCHKGTWIPVSQHPEAVKYENYGGEFLYCLNTSSKVIEIDGILFTDWDEVYGERLDKVLDALPPDVPRCTESIHPYLDGGLHSGVEIRLQNGGEWVPLSLVKVNDVLEKGEKVYGTVKLQHPRDLGETLFHLLTDRGTITFEEATIKDYNGAIDQYLI